MTPTGTSGSGAVPRQVLSCHATASVFKHPSRASKPGPTDVCGKDTGERQPAYGKRPIPFENALVCLGSSAVNSTLHPRAGPSQLSSQRFPVSASATALHFAILFGVCFDRCVFRANISNSDRLLQVTSLNHGEHLDQRSPLAQWLSRHPVHVGVLASTDAFCTVHVSNAPLFIRLGESLAVFGISRHAFDVIGGRIGHFAPMVAGTT